MRIQQVQKVKRWECSKTRPKPGKKEKIIRREKERRGGEGEKEGEERDKQWSSSWSSFVTWENERKIRKKTKKKDREKNGLSLSEFEYSMRIGLNRIIENIALQTTHSRKREKNQ